ncbi:MAG: phosphatase PAP2 family protein [Roseivirga sp.]|nr:phosphatase PAP2 family protein [Roseivirga sp.]
MSQRYVIDKELQWLVAVYLIVLGMITVLTNHGDVVLWINARHTVQGDFFFKYWTYLGDGVILGAVALYFLFTHLWRFYFMLLAIALQTAFVHIFKQWLYAGEPRPKTFFADQIDQLNFVEGVTVRGYDSFPSGHTATAFVLGMVLIWVSKNLYWRFVLFVSAILVGISRIYILQHFARDVFFGSIFGILAVVLSWQILRKQAWNPRLERGLIKR